MQCYDQHLFLQNYQHMLDIPPTSLKLRNRKLRFGSGCLDSRVSGATGFASKKLPLWAHFIGGMRRPSHALTLDHARCSFRMSRQAGKKPLLRQRTEVGGRPSR